MSDIYRSWGFAQTPFATTALEANEIGATLLVGRDTERDRLRARLLNPPKAVTVEGPNGIGKTSLVNVTTFQSINDFFGQRLETLLLPCVRSFQLATDTTPSRFEAAVFAEVCRSMLEFLTTPRKKHLTSAAYDELFATRTVDGLFGLVSAFDTHTTALDTSQPAVQALVGGAREMLARVFPTPPGGGVVCIIDNMELMLTSEAARRLLEDLRDRLFNVKGLRWVLCGATGIVLSVAASPRLQGHLHAPIELAPLDNQHSSKILPSRQAAFATGASAKLPLTTRAFESLYGLFRGNLRAALGSADDYCMWVYDSGESFAKDEVAEALFSKWLSEETKRNHDAVAGELAPRAIEVFEKATSLGGLFSPSDFAQFGANSQQALRPHVKALEDVGLLVSAQDDLDRRRKTITVTPKGWFVYQAMHPMKLPTS